MKRFFILCLLFNVCESQSIKDTSDVKDCKVGQKYQIEKEVYILAYGGRDQNMSYGAGIVGLISITNGNCWGKFCMVKNPDSLTREEFRWVCGRQNDTCTTLPYLFPSKRIGITEKWWK